MADKGSKTTMVAFKIEAELAELLSRLPNKSEFIRKAIMAQLGTTCPLCNGKGEVARFVHDHYFPLIQAARSRNCAACGGNLRLPDDPGALSSEDRIRLEQFFHGGPLYCSTCFEKAPACEECGWHIDGDRVAEHRAVKHSN